MQSPPKQTLLELWAISQNVIHRQVAGISHAESLIQPPFQGNCMNWVVGHILTGRDTCLELLRILPCLSKAETELYARGSNPLTSPTMAVPLDELVKHLDQSYSLLTAKLGEIAQEVLDSDQPFRGDTAPLGGHLAFQHFHESYHAGQLELLRQLAGKNDQVIK